MPRVNKVIIELVKGSKTDYLIKDCVGITIGRFIFIERDKQNKKVTIRLKFYRGDKDNLLKETVDAISKEIFKSGYIYKVNILVCEDIDFSVFLNNGFILEGILTDNVYSDGVFKSELIFGITSDAYNIKENIVHVLLKGKNLTLKNLTPNYNKETLNYYINNKKHLEKFEPFRDDEFYSLEGQKKILIEGYKQFINGTSLEFGIFKEEKFIGKVKLSSIVFGVFKSAYLGYSIDQTYEGNGFMTEAVKLVIDYAFKEMGLHRLEASTLIENEKSQSVLKKCGFEEMGVNRKYLFINGMWQDHKTFYKINE